MAGNPDIAVVLSRVRSSDISSSSQGCGPPRIETTGSTGVFLAGQESPPAARPEKKRSARGGLPLRRSPPRRLRPTCDQHDERLRSTTIAGVLGRLELFRLRRGIGHDDGLMLSIENDLRAFCGLPPVTAFAVWPQRGAIVATAPVDPVAATPAIAAE